MCLKRVIEEHGRLCNQSVGGERPLVQRTEGGRYAQCHMEFASVEPGGKGEVVFSSKPDPESSVSYADCTDMHAPAARHSPTLAEIRGEP